MKKIRLYFEPKKETNVNHDEMFKHYAGSWLDGFDAQFGGSISMNLGDKVEGRLEPVYQYIIDKPSEACANYLWEYIKRNPLCGYYVHMYVQHKNKNSVHYGVIE